MSENNNEEKLQERLRNLENSSLKTVRDANDALKNCLEENEKLRQELRFDLIFNVRLRNRNYFSNLRLLQQQSVNKLVQVAEDTLVCEGGWKVGESPHLSLPSTPLTSFKPPQPL